MYTKEAIFCVKYLKRLGLFNPHQLEALSVLADKSSVEFSMKEVKKDFFTELAEALRPLWPSGDKDGKWAWRDSVENLATRLSTLWRIRELGEYSVDTCVEIARQYLARYENNAKFMQVLKYFILKQKKVIENDGKIHYVNQSVFADMLESSTVEEQQQREWNKLLEEATIGEGTLV